jgi:hypothetical protein
MVSASSLTKVVITTDQINSFNGRGEVHKRVAKRQQLPCMANKAKAKIGEMHGYVHLVKLGQQSLCV